MSSDSSFPEYAQAGDTVGLRERLLDAMVSCKATHEALLRNDRITALTELDDCLEILGDARSSLVAPPPTPAPVPAQCRIDNPPCESCQ